MELPRNRRRKSRNSRSGDRSASSRGRRGLGCGAGSGPRSLNSTWSAAGLAGSAAGAGASAARAGRSGTSRRCGPARPGGGTAPACRTGGTAGRCAGRRGASGTPARLSTPVRPPRWRHQHGRGDDEGVELVVGEGRDRRPRVVALGEERLAAPDVADAGDDPLVEQQLADRGGRRPCPRPAPDLVEVEGLDEHVGPETFRAGCRAMARGLSSSTTGALKQTATRSPQVRTRRAWRSGRRQGWPAG